MTCGNKLKYKIHAIKIPSGHKDGLLVPMYTTSSFL